MNKGFIYVISIFAAVVSGYLSVTMLFTLGKTVWFLIAGGTVIAVVYFFLRISYLKKQGKDLLSDLREPYNEWEERESECREMDLAK